MTKTFEIKPLFAAQMKGYQETLKGLSQLREESSQLDSESRKLMKDVRLAKRDSGIKLDITKEVSESLEIIRDKQAENHNNKTLNEYKLEMYTHNMERLLCMTLRDELTKLPTDKKLNKRHFDKMVASIQETIGGNIRIAKSGIINQNNLSCYYSSDDRLVSLDITMYSVIEDDGTLGEKWKTIYQYDIIHDVDSNAKKVMELAQQKARLEDEIRGIEKEISGYKYYNQPDEKPLNAK